MMFAAPDVPHFALERHERTTRSVITGGMSVGLFAGLSSVAFAIVGVAGGDASEMGACATIAVGLALVVEAWALAARWADGTHVVGRETIDVVGIVAAMVGGFGCLVLGLLAVAGFAPPTLLACAAMVLGTSLVISGPAQHDLAVLAPTASPWGRMTRGLERASTRIMMASGVVAFALGAVAIAVLGPAISLVASLAGALAVVLSTGPVLARFTRRLVWDAGGAPSQRAGAAAGLR